MAERVSLIVDAKTADAIKNLTKFNKTLGATGNQSSSLLGSLSNLKAGWLAVGAGVAVAATAMSKAIMTASDLEETSSKFEAVFKGVGEEAENMARELQRGYGLGIQESKKLLGATGDLLTGFGMSSQNALELSTKVQALAVDLASFTNIEGGATRASEALTAAMLGERERLKALGIVVNEENIKQELFRQGKEKLTGAALLQAKAEATLALAISQSKNAIGDYEKTQGSFANQWRLLQARISDVAGKLGTLLLPIATRVVSALVKGATWISENWDILMKKWELVVISFKKDGENLKTNFDALASYVKLIGLYIVKAFVWTAEQAFRPFIAGINLIIDGLNKFRSTQIAHIGNVASTAKGAIDSQIEAEKLHLESLKEDSEAKMQLLKDEAVLEEEIKLLEESQELERMGRRKISLQKDLEERQKIKDGAVKIKQKKQKDDRLQFLKAEDLALIQAKERLEQERKARLDLNKAKLGFMSQEFQAAKMFASMGNELMQSTNSKVFKVGQALAASNAIISAAEAVMKGYSYGPWIGSGYALLVGTALSIQLSKIRSQKPPVMESGGIIKGSPSGTLIRAGEKGKSEMIVPFENESAMSNIGGFGQTNHITIKIDTAIMDDSFPESVAQRIDNALYELRRNRGSKFAEAF